MAHINVKRDTRIVSKPAVAIEGVAAAIDDGGVEYWLCAKDRQTLVKARKLMSDFPLDMTKVRKVAMFPIETTAKAYAAD